MVKGCGRQHDIPVAFARQQTFMLACCLTYRSLRAGKRRHEADSTEHDEGGPSKKPRTGVSVCSSCLPSQEGACMTLWVALFRVLRTAMLYLNVSKPEPR